MSAVGSLVLMLLALPALILLVGYLLVIKYRQQQPIRESEIVFIPLDVLQRRARNWAIAVSIGLILYGLLKGIGHSAVVAIDGISGFGNIPGFYTSQTISGNWFLFLSTLGLATYFILMGVWRLAGSRFALWCAAPAVAFDLLISFLIALQRFGPDSRGGLIFVLAACLIPMVVTTLLTVAINTQHLVALKAKMDERARANAGA